MPHKSEHKTDHTSASKSGRKAAPSPRGPAALGPYSHAVWAGRQLYLSGQTLAQVGEKFDVSQGTIGRCLRERGAALLADGPRMARSEACR